MRIEGVKEQVARLRKLNGDITSAGRKAMLKAGSLVIKEAKTNRFRKVAGANKKVKYVTGVSWSRNKSTNRMRKKYHGHKGLKVRPIAGILTMRSGNYMRRITHPIEQEHGRIIVAARVPYAQRHEATRPVLTRALEDVRDEIYELVGKDVSTAIHRGNKWEKA